MPDPGPFPADDASELTLYVRIEKAVAHPKAESIEAIGRTGFPNRDGQPDSAPGALKIPGGASPSSASATFGTGASTSGSASAFDAGSATGGACMQSGALAAVALGTALLRRRMCS
ncbi:hypothetical protein OG780_41445 [Streptomyces sp. NBC_00386]|uniref:hypothetical protein n=1 Tax=Streptomyces sp. NBC_00386 TaxID=2975734 RepID=UPI002E208BDE